MSTKDYVIDTLYTVTGSDLCPAYVFNLGKYTYPMEKLAVYQPDAPYNHILFGREIIGTPKYFFYRIAVPQTVPTPKVRSTHIPMLNRTVEHNGYGGSIDCIYDIERNVNILLDVDPYLRKRGITNDYDGGLPFFPEHYAGDHVVASLWLAEDMKELLTEEYFASREIKNKQAHARLREILKKLDPEDNPVVVIAKLK